ncbi:threonine--tRNA ligase [Candidatus Berkelbacteria bacterium CG10_big_fil_rev_8_21_14_0_10_41_12]|uniref:Threonine--tRNA ligase n=1 Tax=Candidatus Berkelbacteria bacterium CG10_big_fil_rev_8_21_14_0_10_41_12 TaxID=1974513 RepID=A0A2M6WY24_9BACT|nr:MAG: threonine--tRNA ligase [Candidatus Berkelbacteria bacterium CG10_big_fil_rev_8_21_14_0_10_41_12]
MDKDKIDIDIVRHSLSHVLAAAVVKMFPEAKLGIGPAIESGFYYDFDLPRTLIPEDLPLIEKKIREIIASGAKFEKVEISVDEALDKLKKSDEVYKCELVKDLKGENVKGVTLYKTGDFIDLCKGPHVNSTADLKDVAFKLDKIAGAYWKGNEKNKMLQRIYGLAFTTQEELDDYLKMLKEAERRDHKKLGRELELFFFDENSPGMPYWLPKGLTIYNTLLDFWRSEHISRGYQEVKTPLMNKKELYVRSGHWEYYRENMFISETNEGEIYALKPMNCPNAMIVYGIRPRSYRELPLRLSDADTIHRFELSGTLNGLFRARSFSQDDAHIFIKENQIESEYKNLFEIVERFYSVFDLKYSYRIGTRPDKYLGEKKIWDEAERILNDLLDKSGRKYTIKEGDGAFYGPKIDILMKDCLGRDWQMGTLQLDFQLPQNFNLKYTDEDGGEKVPVAIHRVIYGSLERFIGILTEHYGGAFPVWIAPIQVIILTISDKQIDYAEEIKKKLEKEKIRVELDARNESINKKIRGAELQKIPYMLIIGQKEVEKDNLSLRSQKEGDLGEFDLQKFIKRLKDESPK